MLIASLRKMRLSGLLVILGVGLSPMSQGQTALDETMTALQEWVEMERRIADESADWAVEKETLNDLLSLYKDELSGLSEMIAAAENDVSAAEAERAKLNAEAERLSVIEDKVVAGIVEAEKALKALHVMLPVPLQEQIQPVFSQLPEDSDDTRLSIGQRIQFLVATLTQIQKFNTTVVVEEDFREFGQGNQVQIDTLYFGLGAAYYVDKANENAGYGVIGANGWEWRDDPSLAEPIRRALDVYKTPGKAAFVELPVEIK